MNYIIISAFYIGMFYLHLRIEHFQSMNYRVNEVKSLTMTLIVGLESAGEWQCRKTYMALNLWNLKWNFYGLNSHRHAAVLKLTRIMTEKLVNCCIDIKVQ